MIRRRLPAIHTALAVGLAALGVLPAMAQVASPFAGPALAQDRVLSRAIGSLEVSAALLPGNVIPLVHSGYGKSTSFPVSWTPVPGAKAYAVIVEELDKGETHATLYWLAYNIPGTTSALPRSIRDRQEILGEKAMMQGRNSFGGIGYIGPKPAVGDGPHHYHIQVFALTRMLPLPGGADLDQVIKAMSDRVMAEGDLVATFEAPQPGDHKAARANKLSAQPAGH